MKLLNCFNMAQDAYNITLAMRARDIDADLLITNQEYNGDKPAWENGECPNWVKVLKVPRRRVLRDTALLVRLARIFPKYDLTFCHYPSTLQAYMTNAKYVPYDSGAIRYLPFSKQALPTYRKHFLWTNTLLKLLKRSYKKAPVILFTNPDTLTIFREAELNVKFVPFVIDCNRYKQYAKLGTFNEFNPVFFMPSRHHWVEKGTDKVIRAYSRFERLYSDSLLVLVNWGTDVERSRQLIRDLDVQSVLWVEPMPKNELIQMYSEADVVLDQFTLGSWGTATPEAMACQKPVIMYYNSAAIKDCFGSLPPILNAYSEEDILEKMEQCVNPDFRRLVGIKSRDWIRKTHDPDLVVDIHLNVANMVLNS